MQKYRLVVKLLIAIAVLFAGAGNAYAFEAPTPTGGANTTEAGSLAVQHPNQQGSAFKSYFTAQSTSMGPKISDVRAISITEDSAVIIWATDPTSTSAVIYDTAPNDLHSTASDSQEVFQHAILLSSLAPNTEHFFKVSSTSSDGTTTDDNSGNLYSFTTLEQQLVRRAFVGVVEDDPGSSVTLTLNETDDQITIQLTSSYELKTPGGPRAGTFVAGARVVILSEIKNGELVAIQVLVKPVTPTQPITGVVTTVDGNTVTVITPKGKTITFEIGDESELPDVGELVTSLGSSNDKNNEVVKTENVRKRLLKFLESINDDENGDANIPIAHAEVLIEALQDLDEQEIQIINDVLTQAPAQAQAGIFAERGRIEEDLKASQEAISKAKSKLDKKKKNDDDDDSPGNSNVGSVDSSDDSQGDDADEDEESPGGNSSDDGQSEDDDEGEGSGNSDNSQGKKKKKKDKDDDDESPGNGGTGQGNNGDDATDEDEDEDEDDSDSDGSDDVGDDGDSEPDDDGNNGDGQGTDGGGDDEDSEPDDDDDEGNNGNGQGNKNGDDGDSEPDDDGNNGDGQGTDGGDEDSDSEPDDDGNNGDDQGTDGGAEDEDEDSEPDDEGNNGNGQGNKNGDNGDSEPDDDGNNGNGQGADGGDQDEDEDSNGNSESDNGDGQGQGDGDDDDDEDEGKSKSKGKGKGKGKNLD